MAEAPTQTQQRRPIINVVFHLGGGGANAGNKPGTSPATKASIEAMPKIKVRESGRDCSICLEEFEVDGEGREMPCKHVFHSGCIEKWLQIHGSCPVCRFLMPAETVEVGGGRGLEFLHSLLAYASRTNLIGAAGSARGSHQPASGRADDDDTPSN